MAEKRPVKITETILRDAHQSLIATRMPTEKMLPIIETMDKVGIKVQCCLGVIDKSEYMCDDIIYNIDESLGDTELDGLPIAKLS